MKNVFLFILLTSGLSISAQNVNIYNISRATYSIPSKHALGVNRRIGTGINMNDPDNPELTQLLAFNEQTLPGVIDFDTTTITTNEIGSSSFVYIDNSSLSTYSQKIYANFKASYGLSSASASYARSVNESNSFHSVLIVIEFNRTQSTNNPKWEWQNEPSSEQIEDFNERREQFLRDYGTHFITGIDYGFRLAVDAKISKSTYSDVQQFAGDLKVALGSFSAGGGINTSTARTLDTKGTRITSEMYGVLKGGSLPLPTTLEGVAELLNKLRTGQIQIKASPITFHLASYWPRLLEYPKTRAIFSPSSGQTADSPFGVPSGTIIAFYPENPVVYDDGTATPKNTWLPEGWSICDGTNGTPDLTERFILGSSPIQLGSTGGSKEHVHSFRASVSEDAAPDASHFTSGSWTLPADHLPPYFKLIYIMKQ